MSNTNGLFFLKSLMREASDDSRPLYAPDRLRFALELPPGDSAIIIHATRAGLIDLLNSDRFILEPLFDAFEEGDALFFVFSPNGIDRTLPEDILYAIAADLRTELRLVSCEPDIGATAYVEPQPDTPPSTEGVIADALCWAQGAAPPSHVWALDSTRVPRAWAMAPGKGQGIIIAQPDTGIADHVELQDATLDLTKALNLVEGGTNPADPLSSSMSNPGHGTATGSVAASGEAGKIKGSAPKATLVPIRCINDVKIFNGTPVARSVDHAVRIGAHVITMSLGGIWSRSLRVAIRRAIAKDIIVLSAAGNCVGMVVWPAAYSEAIAVGGTNIDDKKWKGSSFGPLVDFSAPAEFVWRAERKAPASAIDTVSGGQGTSFATALSAGIAALWIEHHGRDKVIATARQRGTVVQELFRAAVQRTARRPQGFHSGLGAGIIDAEKLLAQPLSSLSLAMPETARAGDDPSGGLAAALTEVLGPGAPDPDFDWAAHGAEISALLIADARAGRSPEGAGREARAFRWASESLTEAAASARDPRVAQLALRGKPPAPSIVIPEPVSEDRLARVLSGLGAGTRADLAPEAAAAVTPEQGRAALDAEGRRAVLGPLQRRVDATGRAELARDVEAIDRSLAELHAEGTSAALDEMATLRVEALVSLTERPALAVGTRTTPDNREVQTVDTTDPDLGRFAGLVELARPGLESGPLAAVGRIDGDGIHLGTGFVVGPGLVMTNRHVLEEFASPLPRAEAPSRWQMVRAATIDFSPGGFDPMQRFRITGIAFAGAEPISRLPISFDKLDLALLLVEATNAEGAALPGAIPVIRNTTWPGQSQNLYVVGFPAPPSFVPRDEHGAMRHDVIERLREIFGLRYRQKYFSPGMVLTGQAHRWVFDHDATTLGGNSGSLTGVLGGSLEAIGLHFAGDWLRANHAHDLGAVLKAEAGLAALLP